MAGHQREPPQLLQLQKFRALCRRCGERLLDQDVLAALEGQTREREVRSDRRGDHDRVEAVVRQKVAEVGRAPDRRVPATEVLEPILPEVADPCNLHVRYVVEVANEIRTP